MEWEHPDIASYPLPIRGTLGETLWLNARHFGARIAVATAGVTLTHGQLHARGHRLAAALAGAGVDRSQRIAMLSMNRAEMVEIYAAAEIAGIAVAPLNFRLSGPELAKVIDDCRPSLLFVEDRYADLIASLRPSLPANLQYVCIGTATPWATEYEAFASAAPDFVEWSRFDPGSLACILYTSGTTGDPKGVMHSHRSFGALGTLVTAKLGLTASTRALVMMPLFHMGGKSVQLGVHWSGGELFVHSGFDPGAILDTIEADRITMVHLAPTMIQTLLDHPGIEGRDLSSLRTVFYSAAPMSEPVLRRGLEMLGPIFIQSYGQTEGSGTLLPAACHRPDGSESDRRHLVSVGVPARGVDIKVVDDSGAECPVGMPGEVMFRTDCAMIGYWNKPEATAETLVDGWIRTGDIGRLDDEGYLFLVDRKKDVIISGGENIYTREVENAIIEHPEVVDVAVIGVPHDKWGEAVCAIIVRTEGSALGESGVIEHCRNLIASYKKPQFVRFVEELPRLASGKVDKKVLRGSLDILGLPRG